MGNFSTQLKLSAVAIPIVNRPFIPKVRPYPIPNLTRAIALFFQKSDRPFSQITKSAIALFVQI
ncbi:hypothetical protein QUB70_05580 [Microcoleus sp. A003_D6]|uniref:hypothetical protein n=1 Tax=Microcoleus sp. A003_D6 TaxID=3055266 RepID=UPI002FD623DF